MNREVIYELPALATSKSPEKNHQEDFSQADEAIDHDPRVQVPPAVERTRKRQF